MRTMGFPLATAVLDKGPDGDWGHAKVKEFWQEISTAHNTSAPRAIDDLHARHHAHPDPVSGRRAKKFQFPV